MVNILSDLLYTNQAFALRNFSIKSTSLSMPSLGMEVYGYDPYISIDAAWNLSSQVRHCVT